MSASGPLRLGSFWLATGLMLAAVSLPTPSNAGQATPGNQSPEPGTPEYLRTLDWSWYAPPTSQQQGTNLQKVQLDGYMPSTSSNSPATRTYGHADHTLPWTPPPTSANGGSGLWPSSINAHRCTFCTPVNFNNVGSGVPVERTLKEFQRAKLVTETAGDKLGQMVTHTALAQLFVEQGNFAQALEHLNAAELMVSAASNPSLRMELLRTRFAAHMQSGDFETALADNSELMPLLRGNYDSQAETYLGSAWAFQSIGNIPQAIACYEDALTEFQNAKDADGQVRAQIGLGSLYRSIGRLDKASALYRAAVPNASKAQFARILVSIAEMFNSNGHPQEAIVQYEKSQTLIDPVTDPEFEASILTGIARACMSIDEFHRAEANLDRARTVIEKSPNQSAKAAVIASQGELNYWIAVNETSRGENPGRRLSQSLKYYEEALPLMHGVGDQYGEIGILTNSGLVYEAMRKSRQALAFYLASLDKMEELQTSARLEEFRANFASQSASLYGRAIQLELEAGRPEEALALSERARARMFLDKLGNSRIDKTLLVPPEFLGSEGELRHESIMLERQLGQLLSKPSPEINPAQVEEIRNRLSTVRGSYAGVLAQVRLSNSAQASLLSVSPITLSEAQQQIPADTTIVSYFTLPDETFAFVLTRYRFRVKKLNVTELELFHDIALFRDFPSGTRLSPSLKSLYKSLIVPIQAEITTRNLVIVPFGVLHELPFAALTSDEIHFLGEEHTISYLPSISTLAYLHPKPRAGTQRVLILANGQEEGLPQLSYAAEEAHAVAALFDARILFGRDATATSLQREASDFDIIHLVAHFEIDTRNPMVSRILMDGGPEDESALDIAGIYKLTLRKTDMVVLSGCQSESGRRSRGDDILNFSRAFMYAGSPSVMASLWGVDDDATQLLMVAFYKHLRQGQSKAEALRSAQVDLRETYPNPFYWAGFILNGDPGQAVQRN